MPNISRKNMPQVSTQNLSKAIKLISTKVKITKGNIVVGKLKRAQKELYKDKVTGIAAKFTTPSKLKPLIISNDNHIVDGHHRWAAAIEKWGDGVKVPVIKINLPILKAIDVYNAVAQSINEDINIPINVGDTVLGGKFKNKRIVVKSIETNEKGDITINGKPFMKFRLLPKVNIFDAKNESTINEIPMDDLKMLDAFADKKLKPLDIVLTGKHFFDRLNDPRNGKAINISELIGFFKRLSKKRKVFVKFLNTYNSVIAKDDRTNLNIPFMKQSNKAIAKTIMRKSDFKSSDKSLDI